MATPTNPARKGPALSNHVILELGWNTSILIDPAHLTTLAMLLGEARVVTTEYLPNAVLVVAGGGVTYSVKTQGQSGYSPILIDRKEHSEETVAEFKEAYKVSAALRPQNSTEPALTFEAFCASIPK